MIPSATPEGGAIVRPLTEQGLPALVDRAAAALASARTSAEVLEARDMAAFAYDAAKRAARLQQAKGAHDTLVAAAHRAQADALLIESQAKRRLADEYDAAQERGEVAGSSDGRRSDPERLKPTAADIGLSRKAIHEARKVRDLEERDPGAIGRVLDEALAEGREPTRALVREKAFDRHYYSDAAAEDTRKAIDKRDFKALKKLWKACSPSVKELFRAYIS